MFASQHKCSNGGQPPSKLLRETFPISVQYRTFGIRVHKGASENQGSTRTSEEVYHVQSPSTQHVQKSAFQGSSAKERKRGKRSLCRSYKLHNSCHSMTTCSCLRSRQKPQHLQCEEVLTRYFALNKGLVQTELFLSDSDRTSVDPKPCAQAPAQIRKVCGDLQSERAIPSRTFYAHTNGSTNSPTSLLEDGIRHSKMRFHSVCGLRFAIEIF